MDQVEYIAPNIVNGLNLYAYCLNNPVGYSDPKGTFVITAAGIVTAIKVAVVVIEIAALVLILTSSSIPEEPESTITSEDVNINSANPGGYIQVEIKENNIRIVDSYKITEKKDQERVIDIIMGSELYNQYGYYRTKESYLSEWRAHNFAYGLPGLFGFKDNAQHVDLDKNSDDDPRSWIYGLF